MNYVPRWERLREAVERVSTTGRIPRLEAQTYIAGAISDGAIDLRAKLGRHTTSGMTYSTGQVSRKDLQIPPDLDPKDIDWENSRPLTPWYVKRGNVDVPRGYWTLEWIELSRSDVTTVLLSSPNTSQPPATSGKRVAKVKGSPLLERARKALAVLYPDGVPDQVAVSNKVLCRRVHDELTDTVSNDTILRAAGRRK